MNWVEAVGKTVDEAIAEAMKALNVESDRDVDVEVLQEPKPGFLGLGGREALVRVTAKPRSKRRRRRRSAGSEGAKAPKGDTKGEKKQADEGGAAKKGRKERHEGHDVREDKRKSRNNRPKKAREGTKDRGGKMQSGSSETIGGIDIEQQAGVAKEFVEGLIGAFGLEGAVATRIDEDILYVDITGEQTEALIGPRGSVMQAILELTRTVIQRKTFGAPRMRIDISGYAERRREALNIYARKLAEKVMAEGGEVMLEAMNPADRKVVHDAVSEIEGVRSFSEGEDPQRSVVIAAVED
jgi:spoIIIJ-associated protein